MSRRLGTAPVCGTLSKYDILPCPIHSPSQRPFKVPPHSFPFHLWLRGEDCERRQGESNCIGGERSRIASLLIRADITENNALVSTPRRCSYHNIIHTGMMYSLALWTDAGPSGVEIGAERARCGLVRDLVSEFAWHAHNFTSVLLRRPAQLSFHSPSYFNYLGESNLGPSDLREDAVSGSNEG